MSAAGLAWVRQRNLDLARRPTGLCSGRRISEPGALLHSLSYKQHVQLDGHSSALANGWVEMSFVLLKDPSQHDRSKATAEGLPICSSASNARVRCWHTGKPSLL